MADPAEIMSALEILTAAYPDKTLSKATIQVYISALRDIPIDVLYCAVQKSILTSPWFPRVSDLYGLSLKIAGVRRFESLTDAILDGLHGESIELYASVARGEPLDEHAWRSLADKYDYYGCPDLAERTLNRLAAIQEGLAGRQPANPLASIPQDDNGDLPSGPP